MLLVIDIGNTNTVLGIFDGNELLMHWRLISAKHTADELGIYLLNLISLAGITPKDIDGAAFSSVVPPLDAPWEDGVRRYLSIECLKVTSETDIGVPILYKTPAEVGADRLVNAVAGIDRYGSPLIIVDFGTAITLDAISPAGEYLGGAIAPGLVVSMRHSSAGQPNFQRCLSKFPKRSSAGRLGNPYNRGCFMGLRVWSIPWSTGFASKWIMMRL